MSYILEALRRAERERQAGQPGDSLAGNGPQPLRRMRPTTLVLAAATLFLAGVGAAALLLRPPGAVPAPQPTPFTVAAPEPLPQTSAPVQEAMLEDRSLPAEDAGSLDDIAPVFQGTPVLVSPAPTAETPPQLVPASEPPIATAAATTTATPAPQRPPTLRQLPPELRARFPELVLQVHVHNADPARRWIMVANRRHGEGAVLDGGVRVIEILADGVIFELDGNQLFWPLTR